MGGVPLDYVPAPVEFFVSAGGRVGAERRRVADEKPGTPDRHAKVKDMVADGVYMAAAATRLKLKNRILVETLVDNENFDVEAFVPHAKKALLSLAKEAEADAKRVHKERRRAAILFSDSYGTHDYRRGDVRNLKRRERQSAKVAEKLRELAANPAQLRQLVEEAREAAWTEVARNIERTLAIEAARPDLEPDYAKLRTSRMQSLRLVDLPRLAAHRRQNEEGAAEQRAEEQAAAAKDAAEHEAQERLAAAKAGAAQVAVERGLTLPGPF
jgi:hypothetical protein